MVRHDAANAAGAEKQTIHQQFAAGEIDANEATARLLRIGLKARQGAPESARSAATRPEDRLDRTA